MVRRKVLLFSLSDNLICKAELYIKMVSFQLRKYGFPAVFHYVPLLFVPSTNPHHTHPRIMAFFSIIFAEQITIIKSNWETYFSVVYIAKRKAEGIQNYKMRTAYLTAY